LGPEARYTAARKTRTFHDRTSKNEAIRTKIQSFMGIAAVFPALWAENEYPSYFEKIFGEAKNANASI